MSRSIKVRGFFKDIKGIDTITELRRKNYEQASAVPDPVDFVRELADKLHPASGKARVVAIKDASAASRTYRFVSADGHIPVFQCGQYVNFRLKIGGSELTRPYSISSAPYQARTAKPFFEITIRRSASCFVPDYFFERVKVGDVLDANLPFGTFYWEPLRDTPNIVALAGGCGITPFASMAKEIAHGKMQGCKLTILFGSVKADDMVLREELEAVQDDCKDIKVIPILSEEKDWPGEKGFITKEIIEKYSGNNPTYMFCGPLPMYTFVRGELQALRIPERRFRHDVVGNPADVTKLPGYPQGTAANRYQITVMRGIQRDVISADAGEAVAVALERAAIKLDTHCRNGACGFCRSQLLSGDIFVSPLNDGRRMMDKEMGWFHPCSAYPLSDLTIRIPIM